MASVTYEAPGLPTATVTDEASVLTAVITGIEGLAPAREPNDEEELAGITSLSPPTATTSDGPQALVDLAQRAVSSAVYSTAPVPAPADVMVRMKTIAAVNGALRELGYDV